MLKDMVLITYLPIVLESDLNIDLKSKHGIHTHHALGMEPNINPVILTTNKL